MATTMRLFAFGFVSTRMRDVTTSASLRASAWETYSLFGGFLLVGVITVLLGPLIPELQSAWGINHAQTGSLFLLQYAASSIASLISSLHLRRSLIAGWALAALGLAGLSTGEWSFAHLSVSILGFAMGLLIPSFNLQVARRNPERRGAALSGLNLTWGVGAVSSPLLFAAFAQRIGAFAVVAAVAGLAGACCVIFVLVLRDAPPTTRTVATEIAGAPLPPRPSLPPTTPLALLAGLLLLYVGAETSVAGWLVALSDQFSASRSVVSLIIGSGFWGAVLVGRAAAALLLRRLGEHVVYWTSLTLALTGTLTLLFAKSQVGVAVGAVVAGAGLAPLYPLTVSILAEATATRHSRLAGVVMASGGIGGALLPWLAGRISQAAAGGEASLSRGFIVPTVALIAIAGLYSMIRAARARSAPS